MKRKTIITIGVVLAILVAGYFGFQAWGERQAEALLGDLETEKVEYGLLKAYVGATGTVHANQSVTLPWETTGTVDEVMVTIGDMVTEGETLATLRQSSLPQNVILAQADLVSAEQALEDLLEQYTDATALAQAAQNIALARERLDEAQDEIDDINYVGPQDDIDDAYREYQKAFNEMKDALAERDRYDNPNSTKYRIADYQYRLAYDAYATALGNYNYETGNTVDEIERAIIEADLEVAKQELADAEEAYQDLLDGPQGDDISAAEARVAAAQAALELAWIEAPFAGMVTMAEPLPGDNISNGTPAFRIDDFSHLLVDVEVSEIDINRVEIGQAVTLTFDAILAKEYTGEVIEVAPVGEVSSGVVNFTVTIELTDADELVRPGMTAAVNIVVSELENVLLVPNRAVRVVDNERVVYVMKNGILQTVSIELGSSSDAYSEVAGGDLSEGDNVVLNPPTNIMMFDGPPAGFGN